MLKHILALLLLSILIVFTMKYAQHGVQLLLTAHDFIAEQLSDVFTAGHAGNMAKGLIALLSVPIIIGLIPTMIYWGIRRIWFPYFMQIVWIVWLIQAGALLMMYKVAA